MPKDLTPNQKKLLEIYKEFKKPTLDEVKLTILIDEIKKTDPDLTETQIRRVDIPEEDRRKFCSSDDVEHYSISGLADVRVTFPSGNSSTAFGRAIDKGNLGIIELFLEKHPEKQQALVFHQADGTKLTAFGHAVLLGKEEVVKLFLKNLPSNQDLLEKSLDKVALTFADGATQTAFGRAIDNGNLGIIELFLEKHPAKQQALVMHYKDGAKETAFGYAAFYGFEKVVKLFLENLPSNQDLPGESLDKVAITFPNRNSSTAFGRAINKGNLKIIKLFLEKHPAKQQALVFHQANGAKITAFGWAASLGKEEVVKFFIEQGADVDAVVISSTNPAQQGLRAFDVAVHNKKFNIAKILLEHCAYYRKFDGRDNCPVEIKDELQAEINKIKKTEAVYRGNFSVPFKEINPEFLKNLCKRSGIPKHFLSDNAREARADYSDIIKSIQEEKRKSLSEILGKLLRKQNVFLFPAIDGFEVLNKLEKTDSAQIVSAKHRTLLSYKENQHLRPDRFLKNEKFEEKLGLMIGSREVVDEFFKVAKGLALSEEERGFLSELENRRALIPPAVAEHKDAILSGLEAMYVQSLEADKELHTLSADLVAIKQELEQYIKAQIRKLSETEKICKQLKQENLRQAAELSEVKQENLRQAAELSEVKQQNLKQAAEMLKMKRCIEVIMQKLELEQSSAQQGESTAGIASSAIVAAAGSSSPEVAGVTSDSNSGTKRPSESDGEGATPPKVIKTSSSSSAITLSRSPSENEGRGVPG